MRYIKSYNNTTDLKTDLDDGKLDHPYVAKINDTIDFNSIGTDWKKEYFTIIALSDGTISYSHKEGSNPMFYSINEGEWIETTVSVDITVSKNDMIRFKSNRGNQAYNQETFTSGGTALFEVAGNLMSLVAGDDFATYVPNTSPTGTDGELYCSFKNFFKDCEGLMSAKNLIIKYCDNESFSDFFNGCLRLLTAPKLPATTLANSCYYHMFDGCTNLASAPALPSETMADSCYLGMFYWCTSLTQAPALPATTLAINCYNSMFWNCASLTTAPELPATTLARYCYYDMFYGTNVLPDCSNIDFASSTVVASGGLNGLFSGTKVTDNDLERLLPKNDNGRYYLPATTLAENCYYYMFSNCTSLTTAPALPATTLAEGCYSSMFVGCTSLKTAPELPATDLKFMCYGSMFAGCTSLTNAPALPATTLKTMCYKTMFNGCTSLTNAPALPATKLEFMCYSGMFQGCTNLNYIKCLATDISATSCTSSWVSRVASTGTFVKAASMTSWPTGTSGIPSGWTIIDA